MNYQIRDIESKSAMVKNRISKKSSQSKKKQSHLKDRILGNQSQSANPYNLVKLQTKLVVGRSNDVFEKEANSVADSFISNQISNQISNVEVNNTSKVTTNSEHTIQRMCAECEEEKLLQRESNNSEVASINQGTADQIEKIQNGGQRIPNNIRRPYEDHFGRDFTHVKIHTDNSAQQVNHSINARAYTLGSHIVFGTNQFQPQSKQGQHLLAHELTHVVQQSNHTANSDSIQRQATTSGSTTPTGTAPTTAPVNGGLTDEMLRQIARRLRAAMSGPGTDEEAIYSSLAGRNQEQINAIERVYNQMYSRSLLDDLEDELTRSELLHLGIFSPSAQTGNATQRAQSAADLVAHQLNRAMDRIGTDEESIYAALSGRTTSERNAIKQAYLRLTRQDLEHDIREEMSGSELTRAIRLLNQGLLQPEDELYLAMVGLGTDEDTIFRVVDSLAGNSVRILQVAAAYRSKYGDLIAHLRSDLNAEEYARVMNVLGADLQDVAFEDCATGVLPQIRALIPVGIAKVEHAIQVLSQGWASMSSSQKATFNRFYDPSGSGINDQFVNDVLNNFRSIRREFNDDLTVECETNAGLCSGQRLYYTYWSNIHVCPYFSTSTNNTRKARDFVHELAHNAMLAVDRPYYSPSSTEYAELTPRGIWSNQIPVIGSLSRVISRSDTLYHPDAYSWFAFTVP